ncbi:uncharacterized protein K441DRAFT_719718, partial [Cenococcum geophilum 1.58]|uniref:uncharacterized protein n=1 Tax=Cenococcum geophilum 1.58 TaxID=794803 RepID=UPI0035902AF3
SIVFTIENEKKDKKSLSKKRYQLQGTATKVVKYLEVSPTTQCNELPKIGHIERQVLY